MTQIFLSFRSDDEPFGVVLMDAQLSERFGSSAVFMTSKSIPPGDRWNTEIFDAVSRSTAVLVIMGRYWLTACDDKGRRKIEDPEDFVRREILLAARLNKRIIPVLLGVPRLTKKDLPEELEVLSVLAERQSIDVRFRNALADIDRFADKLAELIPELPRPRRNGDRPATKYHAGVRSGNVFQGDRIEFGTFYAGPTIQFPNPERRGD